VADGPGWKVTAVDINGRLWHRRDGDQWEGPNGEFIRSLEALEGSRGQALAVDVEGVAELVAECLLNRQAADQNAATATRFADQAIAATKREERTRRALLGVHRILWAARRSCDTHGAGFEAECGGCEQAHLVLRLLRTLDVAEQPEPAAEPVPAQGGVR
jgi:hypothetical protein